MVGHHHVVVIRQVTGIDNGLLAILGVENSLDVALSDRLPSGTVFAAHSVALEEHGAVKAQLDSVDVDGVMLVEGVRIFRDFLYPKKTTQDYSARCFKYDFSSMIIQL